MKVKDCMCNDVCCVNRDSNLKEVAKIMSQNHIGCLPVCDNNNSICGIVTDRDLVLRCIACDKDINSTPVSDIMSCNVCTCNEDDEMKTVEQKMSTNQIRRIPVCDSQNKIVGILTLGDLAKNSQKLGEEDVCITLENICDTKSTSKNAE